MEGKKWKVSKKNAQGKWWSYGNIKPNQYGNLSLGFKMTPELKQIFADAQDGDWVNFSLFEDDGEKRNDAPRQSQPQQVKTAPPPTLDGIPW